ncbi:hypothetical protein HMPREF0239_01634 [Clostridium sp. ATCC BAA-442]|nr:hypothetical protein HMPREF0239_01634 [Clostridium sp. ATCC BAA-442]
MYSVTSVVFCGEITFINVPLFFLPLSNSLNPQESSRLGAILRFFFKSVSGDITPLMLFFSAAATCQPVVVVLHVLNFQKFRTNGGKNNGWRSSKKH